MPILKKPDNELKDKSLKSWIWDAACSIRGAKDAPKYKEFILPLIFTEKLARQRAVQKPRAGVDRKVRGEGVFSNCAAYAEQMGVLFHCRQPEFQRRIDFHEKENQRLRHRP